MLRQHNYYKMFNPNKIIIANHRDISLGNLDSYVNDLSQLAYFMLSTKYLLESKSVTIFKSDFYSYLENNFHLDHKRADNILTVFIQTGKIKPINDNRIELVTAV